MDETIIKNLNSFVAELLGQPCNYKHIGQGNSLSLGFGRKLSRLVRGVWKEYSEWEIGTYSSAWRLYRGNSMLFGGGDEYEFISDTNLGIQKKEFGRLASINFIAAADVCIEFDSGYRFEIWANVVDDEYMHIFSPYRTCLELKISSGVRIGASDSPWKSG